MSGFEGGDGDLQVEGKTPPTQRIIDWFHARASTTRPEDIHHRLGFGANEAAPGNHTHDGKDSPVIPGLSGNIGRALVAARNRNRVHNGDFRINQKNFVSGATTTLGATFLDRWRASNNSTTYTWVDEVFRKVVSMGDAGNQRSIRQTIERADMPAGDYVLSWEGTALGRVYDAAASAPSYAASPVLVTISGTDNVRVEFQNPVGAAGTVTDVQMEAGSEPTPFERISYGEALELCQRFFIRSTATANSSHVGTLGSQISTTVGWVPWPLPRRMRTTPTVTRSVTWTWTDYVNFSNAVSNITISNRTAAEPDIIWLEVTFATGGAALRSGGLRGTSTGASVDLSAEF